MKIGQSVIAYPISCRFVERKTLFAGQIIAVFFEGLVEDIQELFFRGDLGVWDVDKADPVNERVLLGIVMRWSLCTPK